MLTSNAALEPAPGALEALPLARLVAIRAAELRALERDSLARYAARLEFAMHRAYLAMADDATKYQRRDAQTFCESLLKVTP